MILLLTQRMKRTSASSLTSRRRISAVMLAAFGLILTTAPLAAEKVDVREQPLAWIKPGTVIGDKAPEGWTHLMFAAYPRLGAGDVKECSRIVKTMAKKFTVSCVANVVATRPEGGAPYRLEKVNLGLGTMIRGKNTIISSEQSMGAPLGVIDGQVLRQCEKDFRTGVIQIVRTPTMCVFDCKAVICIDDEHRDAFLRYVILASETSGQAGTLIWLFDGNYELQGPTMQYLPAGFQEDRVMSVDCSKFFLGLPQKHAMAQVCIAQGTPIEFTPALKSIASQRRYTPESAQQLESELWKLWE